MVKKAFESIKAGLNDAIKHASGVKGGVKKLHHPEKIDVKALRKKMGMTQEEFSETFSIGLGTLKHWERGDRQPRGATLVLLNVIAYNHKTVLKALSHSTKLMS